MASIFRDLGAAIVDADEATHAVYAPGADGFALVVNEFGEEYVREGAIDRAKLGAYVFANPGALRRLDAIVHPLVRQWMADKTARAIEDGAEVVIHDVPLLFENGMQGLYTATVLAYASPETQVRRLIELRGLPSERALAMMAAQMPIDEKKDLADYVIENDGGIESTRAQVKEVWAQLQSL